MDTVKLTEWATYNNYNSQNDLKRTEFETIAIKGCGELGKYIIDGLISTYRFDTAVLIDNSIVTEQEARFYGIDNVGLYKADVLSQLINSRNPETKCKPLFTYDIDTIKTTLSTNYNYGPTTLFLNLDNINYIPDAERPLWNRLSYLRVGINGNNEIQILRNPPVIITEANYFSSTTAIRPSALNIALYLVYKFLDTKRKDAFPTEIKISDENFYNNLLVHNQQTIEENSFVKI